jgi:hypothetical protein
MVFYYTPKHVIFIAKPLHYFQIIRAGLELLILHKYHSYTIHNYSIFKYVGGPPKETHALSDPRSNKMLEPLL